MPTKLYTEIGMTADRNGRPRFHTLSGRRSFPIKRDIALASIKAGCRVYVGSMMDALHGRGHYASQAELTEFV